MAGIAYGRPVAGTPRWSVLWTPYNAVGGKPALLRAVYDVSLAGDDEPVPIAEWPPSGRCWPRPTGAAAWPATPS